MNDQIIQLYQKLKEEFESATNFGDYTYSINYEFELDEETSNETRVEASVVINFEGGSRDPDRIARLILAIDELERCSVYTHEDWDEWCSYDYRVGNLWKAILFKSKDKGL